MNHSCTHLREVVSSVLQIKVDGFCVTKANINQDTGCVRSRCTLDGHDWEIRFHPAFYVFDYTNYCPGLELVFLGESSNGVTAILSGKITTSGAGDIKPWTEIKATVPKSFSRPMDRSSPIYIGVGTARDDFRSCSLTVECSITVFRERGLEGAIPVPASDLPRHLGELLRSEAGADVTFAVSSGESFAAHKGVLAVRSPVFMAEFFGHMKEKDAQVVEIRDMDAAVFRAMLGFIYTDAVPELDDKAPEAAVTLVQHLLVAADVYGLDRLKVMCERRLALGLDVGTVALTLALAEQHNCSRLKAKCIEFIAGGSQENLDAVLASEGYKDLVATSPSVLAELLKAAHGKKRSRSPDDK
ncbi:unnamed protein product [Urochloa decumbens]|uniref:BTB domain-containing protein n=1 Tax=Urochloa decumbens TaxID=240449 RepID=A0ABC9F2P4_9POAL